MADSSRTLIHFEADGAGLNNRFSWNPAIAAAAVAIAIYAITLWGTFIYDDIGIVQLDPRVLQPSLWAKLWVQPYWTLSADKLYRPLTSMSFAIQNWLHRDQAFGFHLVNVVLYAGCCALVAVLGRRLGGAIVGWVAGLLFAAHPVHVEAVAGIVGRSELGCALAMLGGLVIFLRPGPITRWRVAEIWVCFVLALLTKEHGILFPVLLLVAAPLRKQVSGLQAGDNGSIQERRLVPEPDYGPRTAGLTPQSNAPGVRRLNRGLTIALLFTLAVYLLIRERIAPMWWDRYWLDWDVNPLVRSVGIDRVLMPVVLLGHYLRLLVFPSQLSIDYGAQVFGWRVRFNDPYLYAGITALLLWIVLTALAIRGRNFVQMFLLAAVAITYGTISNFVSLIGTNFAERLIYLPSVFVVLWASSLLSRLPRRLMITIVALLLIGGIYRSFTYARLWNDRFAFYQISMQNQPRSERVYALVFDEQMERGDYQGARTTAQLARKNVPEAWQVYAMCAKADMKLNDFDAAEAAISDGLRHYRDLERLSLIEQLGKVRAMRQSTH